MRFGHALGDLPLVAAGRADIGDAPSLDDDLLVLEPATAMDIEQPAYPQQPVGRPPTERSERQILADENLVGRVDEQVVRKNCGQRRHRKDACKKFDAASVETAAGRVKLSDPAHEKSELSQQLAISRDRPATLALLAVEICQKLHFAQLLGL